MSCPLENSYYYKIRQLYRVRPNLSYELNDFFESIAVQHNVDGEVVQGNLYLHVKKLL